MPEITDITKSLKDALYVTVGLGVIAFQKAQVQRRELAKQLDGRVKLVEERLEGVEGRFESILDQLEDRLPEQAKEVAKQARQAAKDARGQLRELTTRRNPTAA